MANAIQLAEKFQPILDEIYQVASLTGSLDGKTKPVDFGGANQVQIYKTSMVGLGNYSRTTGYPVGDVTGTWEILALMVERGRELYVDRMDNDETLGMAYGTLIGEYMRTQVVPEVDAYRFAKYAGASGIQKATPATLTSATVLAAVDAAMKALDEKEVPPEGRKLFVSTETYGFIKAAVSRTLANESAVDRRVTTLDGVELISVPPTRFYTAITLDAGGATNAGGYAKNAASGKDINFMLLHPSAVLQAKKHDKLKAFSPDENQKKDGWMMQYRLYHDAFVYDNKAVGIYLHNKA